MNFDDIKMPRTDINKRIETFEMYVEMFGDSEEEVEVDVNDFLAFILLKSNRKSESVSYLKILSYYLKKVEDGIISVKGTDLKLISDFANLYSVPREFEKPLTDYYKNNELKMVNDYKINYKYYNNKEEYNNIINNNKELLKENLDIYNKIYNYKEDLKINKNIKVDDNDLFYNDIPEEDINGSKKKR